MFQQSYYILRDTQFVQTVFLALVQSYGNILHFQLILVFDFGYITKRLWLQAIVQHWENIPLFYTRHNVFQILFREGAQ